MRNNRVIPEDEQKFLQEYKPKDYAKPSVTADILVFSMIDNKLNILLVKRGGHPYKNYWAIPGGFVNMKESIKEAAYRELKEETGVDDVYLEQLATFGEVDRDPRMRIISIAYIALVKSNDVTVVAGDDASDAQWFEVNELLKRLEIEDCLAFDHEEILKMAIKRLRGKAYYTNVLFSLLEDEFTLTALRTVFEEVFNKQLHASNFRREMLSSKVIATGKTKKIEGIIRPSELYRENKEYFMEEM